MLLLDRILTHIVNHLSNTSYHFQYLYYPGGNETGAKPNLITCITEIFLSVDMKSVYKHVQNQRVHSLKICLNNMPAATHN
jgi:hypothetical protein